VEALDLGSFGLERLASLDPGLEAASLDLLPEGAQAIGAKGVAVGKPVAPQRFTDVDAYPVQQAPPLSRRLS
jgi:hypothetical protein